MQERDNRTRGQSDTGTIGQKDKPRSPIVRLSDGPVVASSTVDKSAGRIRRMFGEIATRYDFLNHFLSAGTDCYWRWRTVRTVSPLDDGPILDVCTGTGDLAFAFWKKGGRRVPVIGADFTHEMLKLANRKRAKALPFSGRPSAGARGKAPPLNGPSSPGPASHTMGRGRTNENFVTFVEADAMRLPFPDDQFQIVSVAFGLRNISDTEAGLREMARVCQPGGRVVILEFSMPGKRVLRSLYRWYFRHVLPRLGQLISKSRDAAYYYLPQSVAEFPQDQRLAEIMNRCGLEPVHWKPLTFGIATLYWGEKG